MIQTGGMAAVAVTFSRYFLELTGWHAPESDAYRWTARSFGLEVTLAEPAREFALRFFVPDAVIDAGAVRVACHIDGVAAGAITCDRAGTMEFRGRFPDRELTQRLEDLSHRPIEFHDDVGISA